MVWVGLTTSRTRGKVAVAIGSHAWWSPDPSSVKLHTEPSGYFVGLRQQGC